MYFLYPKFPARRGVLHLAGKAEGDKHLRQRERCLKTGKEMIRKFLSILLILLCYCNSNKTKETQFTDIKTVLDFYGNYSHYTNPGKYAYLYKSLPDSLTELCELIKCQFIHPVDLEPYRDIIPPDRHYEDPKFPTAEKLLAGLLELDSNGLTFNRKPENRLIVTCRYHSIFLASILKYRGIPVRVRYGFAPYLAPNTLVMLVITTEE